MVDSGGLTLRLHRELPAPRSVVFRACTNPTSSRMVGAPRFHDAPDRARSSCRRWIPIRDAAS